MIPYRPAPGTRRRSRTSRPEPRAVVTYRLPMAADVPRTAPAAVPGRGGPRVPTDFDVLVVGSGFGGSVTALRLTEKGYRVGVLEAGRRFTDEELPCTSWRLRSFLWAPALGCFGIQRIHRLRDVLVLAGAVDTDEPVPEGPHVRSDRSRDEHDESCHRHQEES